MSTALVIRGNSFHLQLGLHIPDHVWVQVCQRLAGGWAALLFLVGVGLLSRALVQPLTQLQWLPLGLLLLTYGEVRLLTHLSPNSVRQRSPGCSP